MTKRDKSILIEGLRKLSQDAADIAVALESAEAQVKKPDEPMPEPEATETATPAKVYTYEEVRAVLAEKSRTGYRAEVKARLTAHGVKQLSDVTDPEVFAALVKEAEVIGGA